MFGQFYGVFSFSASQFKNDRIVVPEKVAAPFPLVLEFFF